MSRPGDRDRPIHVTFGGDSAWPVIEAIFVIAVTGFFALVGVIWFCIAVGLIRDPTQ